VRWLFVGKLVEHAFIFINHENLAICHNVHWPHEQHGQKEKVFDLA